MGEVAAWAFVVLLILVAAAAYLAVLAGYLAFVAPWLVALGGALLALYLIGRWYATFGAVVFDRPQWNIKVEPVPDDKPEPAYRQYFFGPAIHHLRVTGELAPSKCVDAVTNLSRETNRRFFAEPSWWALVLWPLGGTAWAGILSGVIAGAVLLAALLVVHVAVVITVQLLARAAIRVLRALDSIRLRIKHIGLICQVCSKPVGYPRYACPSCDARHDVRPGPYGVVRRRCRCGEKLPTLLLFGSYRMVAFCPDPRCGAQLSDQIGLATDVLLPLFGGTGAGKSQLMWAMVMVLQRLGEEGQLALHLADDETRIDADVLGTMVLKGDRLQHTQTPELPRAHTMQLEVRGVRRHLYLYDAAGEQYLQRDRVDEMRHLGLTRTYLFVLDPLSVEPFWARVTATATHHVDATIRQPIDVDEVYHRTTQAIQLRQVTLERSRLAVVISKADLIRDLPFAPAGTGDEAIREWLTDELGLGNLVRRITLEFGRVRFFLTAAVAGTDGGIDASVTPLIEWLLGWEGIRLGRHRR